MIKTVVLDFGHGGLDINGNYTTAPSKMFTFPDGVVAYEGVINRQIGGHAYTCLRSHADLNIFCTVMEDDPRDISLADRVYMTNAFDPKSTIFVSIHCNASPNHNAQGHEIYTTKGFTESDVLAECIATATEHALGRANIKLRYDFSDGDKDKEADFYVLRKTKCPAVLIECGFFDFRPEFDKLSNPLFQGDYGSMVYTGIINYINGKNKQQG
jgi:N-acetylmuramoyl-L-alanine amidase